MNREFAHARNDFPSLSRTVHGRPLVFLDGPAGTQVPRRVIDAISFYYATSNANTGGAFLTAVESDEMILDTRQHVAALLGAPSPDTISFGQNMTTLAFMLSAAFAKTIREGDEVVITALDHEANRGPWLDLQRYGAVIREVRLGADGRLIYDDFERLITSRTRLVAVGMASNALGTVNDIRRIAPLVRNAGAWLLLDAVHYAPHLPVDVAAVDADFLLCSAYKFYGPHVGILYSRKGQLDSLDTQRLSTAPQTAPGRIETGTLNHAALAGVREAVRYIASWGEGASLREQIVSAMRSMGAHERELALRFWNGMAEIPGVRMWGPDFSDDERAPTVSISMDAIPSDELAKRLAAEGISVWSGHFYARRAVEVLGVPEGGLLRSGFFVYNTEEEIDRVLAAVRKIAVAVPAGPSRR